MEPFQLEFDMHLARATTSAGVGWPQGEARGLFGGHPIVITPGHAALLFSARFETAADVGLELVRTLRGSLGFHFGQPLEVSNVSIRRAADGSYVDTLPRGSWSEGYSDVTAEDLGNALAFLGELDQDGEYALALHYYNAGRLLIRRHGMPEAAIVFFFKVLEALLPNPKDGEKRVRQWRHSGFTSDEVAALERLRTYRNTYDAAHRARGPERVYLTQAHEGESTARLILERCAPRGRAAPRPPRLATHFIGQTSGRAAQK